MPISAGDMDTDVKTFRGRTLEALLPEIKQELGPDAIVLRRREGVAGGVGGFFARSFVEVEARRPLPGESPLEARNDRATAEGLRAPAIQALVEQASPFADALARADAQVAERASDVLLETAGLYGPQPNPAALGAPDARDESSAADGFGHFEIADRDESSSASADRDGFGRFDFAGRDESSPAAEPPAAARAIEQGLVAAGLSAALAADVVGESVAHGLPFGHPRGLKKLVRAALARRIPVLAELGPGRRTIAVVGPGGAGKSALVSRLAAAYEGAGHEVAVAAPGERPDRAALVTLVDTPALGVGDAAAAAELADELRALGCTEVHLALPATIGAAAAEELAGALAPLGLTHLALTHSDQAARPGAPVELAIRTRRPLSYVSSRGGVAPADPAELASRLL